MYNVNKYSPWLATSISIAALFTLAACETVVTEDGGSGGAGANATSSTSSANGGNGNGGSGVAGGNPGTSNAQSMLYGQLQSPPNPTGTSVAASSGGGPDSNTLYIAISNTSESCTDPFAAEFCGNHWRVSFGIPVALQKVGIIALNDPSIISNSSFAGLADPAGPPDQCPFGGGSFWDGELEITAIDQNHVQGILTNTATFDFDANGAFDAPRCMF